MHPALFVNFSTFSPSANQTVVLTDRKDLRDLGWHRSTARIPRESRSPQEIILAAIAGAAAAFCGEGPTASKRSLSAAELPRYIAAKASSREDL